MKRLYAAALAVLLAPFVAPVQAAELEGSTVHDAFIAGQLTFVFERELGWQPEDYSLEVRDGVARVVTDHELPDLADLGVEGLVSVQHWSDTDSADIDKEPSMFKKAYSVLGLTEHTEAFPIGELFKPLIADEHEPRFFASVRPYRFEDADGSSYRTTIGATGFGTSFGLWRNDAKEPGNGWQLSISAAVFSQFDLEADSLDLINADYIVGFPLTFRHNRHSMRIRFYHQSSHLGDEFLINNNPERINFSYEALEVLYGYEIGRWRAYLGGGYALNINPSDLERTVLTGGLEFRSGASSKRAGQWIAGLHVESLEHRDWETNWSFKGGYEFAASRPGQRMKILAEAYDGYTPHGQFYDSDATYYGIGVTFGY
jgi:hypothetical protein